MWQYPLIRGHPLLLLGCHEVKTQSLKVPVVTTVQTQETGKAKLVDTLNECMLAGAQTSIWG